MVKKMKNIKCIFICLMFITNLANAATLTESCPTGSVRINKKYIVLSDGACPTGTINVGTVKSCFDKNPSEDCVLYVAPTDETYTDKTGEYKYNGICPLS